MADQPVGITFMPTAEAAANGPRQAGIEGAGSSDLAQAFKILSLHLPRVLGAPAIAPKRLLTSQGSAGVAAPQGANPYSAVFQALLQSMGAGGSMGGGAAAGGGDVQSLASLFAGSTGSSSGGDMGGGYGTSGTPAPAIVPGSGLPRDGDVNTPPSSTVPSYNNYAPDSPNTDTQYI